MASGGDGDEMEMTSVDLRSWIRELVEKNIVLVNKMAQLAQMETVVKHREKQAAETRMLLSEICEAVVECEGHTKDLYRRMDLVYGETDSEEDGEEDQPDSPIGPPSEDDAMEDDNQYVAASETAPEVAPEVTHDSTSEVRDMVVDTPSMPSSRLTPVPTVTSPAKAASRKASCLPKPPQFNGHDSHSESQTEPRDEASSGLMKLRMTRGREVVLLNKLSDSTIRASTSQTDSVPQRRVSSSDEEKVSSADEWDPQSEPSDDDSEGDSSESFVPPSAKGKRKTFSKRPTPPSGKVPKRQNAKTQEEGKGAAVAVPSPAAVASPATISNVSRTENVTTRTENCSAGGLMLSTDKPHPDTLPPVDLPELEVKVNMMVLARRRTKTWHKGEITEIRPVGEGCKYKVDFGEKGRSLLSGHHIAFATCANVNRLYVGARLVSIYKEGDQTSFYSGVLAELPNRKNRMRFLVFFDDCSTLYVCLPQIYLVCRPLKEPWEDIEDERSRTFIQDYLKTYPHVPMAQYAMGQTINIDYDGVQKKSKVEDIQGSLIYTVCLDDDRKEWIYRGSMRLEHLTNMRKHIQEASKKEAMKSPSIGAVTQPANSGSDAASGPQVKQAPPATAAPAVKGSPPTKKASDQAAAASDPSAPEAAYTPHRCSPACLERHQPKGKTNHRRCNPLAVPMLYNFRRIKGLRLADGKRWCHISYRSPCGLSLDDMSAVHDYLQQTRCDFLFLEMFCLDPCMSTTNTYESRVRRFYNQDLALEKETQPLSCMNEVNSLRPLPVTYNKDRVAGKGVSINKSLDFLVGCDCTDGCRNRSGCSCHQLMVRSTAQARGDISGGYTHRRLEKPLDTGVYECNALCRCDPRLCCNRVVQQGPQLRLQVFMTANKGWGIRCLDDVAKGSFVCTYAGIIRPGGGGDAENDVYSIKLNHIEGAESRKAGYESEAHCSDEEMEDEDNNIKHEVDGGKGQAKDEDEEVSEYDISSCDSDDDFKKSVSTYPRSYVTRRNSKVSQEVRETDPPAKSTDSSESVDPPEEDNTTRCFFDNEKSCYIIDAKTEGNMGRYLNHSCSPNMFVQNVFVDTHDLRFPWVAFFTSKRVRAGSELTWDYRSDIGNLGKKSNLLCRCGSSECRAKL